MSRKRRVIGVLAAATSLAVLSGCATFNDPTKSPASVVRAYYQAATAGDCATAKRYMAPSAPDPDGLCKSLAGTVVTGIGEPSTVDSKTKIVSVKTEGKPPTTNSFDSVKIVRVGKGWYVEEIATTT